MKTAGLTPSSNAHSNSSKDKQSFQKAFSNLFFQLGPSYNRSQQVNVAKKLFAENVVKHQQTDRQGDTLKLRSQIVNEMNDIYGKMTSRSPKAYSNSTAMFNAHEKYNEILSIISSPQSNFFSTEVKPANAKNNKSCELSSIVPSLNKNNKTMSSSLDIKCNTVLSKQKKPTIIRLKGDNTMRMKIGSPMKPSTYKTIEFKELKPRIPCLFDKLIKMGLKEYQMKDRLLAIKKPHFKH